MGSDYALIYQWDRYDVAMNVKECSHHHLPYTSWPLDFQRGFISWKHPYRRLPFGFWVMLINPGFITCKDAVHIPMGTSVESGQLFLGPIHRGPFLFKCEGVGTSFPCYKIVLLDYNCTPFPIAKTLLNLVNSYFCILLLQLLHSTNVLWGDSFFWSPVP